MKRLLPIIIVLIATWMPAPAQEPFYRNHVELNTSFYGDYYDVGLGYHRMLCNWAGIGGSIGCISDSSDGLLNNISSGWWDDDYYYDDYYYEPPVAFYVEPSIILRTPTLFNIRNVGFGLTAQPAFRLCTNFDCNASYLKDNHRYDVSYRCNNISYHLSAAIAIRFEMFEMSVGYKITSLDIDRRYSSPGQYKRQPVQGLFMSLSGYF